MWLTKLAIRQLFTARQIHYRILSQQNQRMVTLWETVTVSVMKLSEQMALGSCHSIRQVAAPHNAVPGKVYCALFYQVFLGLQPLTSLCNAQHSQWHFYTPHVHTSLIDLF